MGRTFVITGANTGVGRATALALAERGATLVLACRSEARAAEVMARLREVAPRSPPSAPAVLVALDLADLASVRRAATQIAARAPRIDVLVNNAGVGGARGETRDGFELACGDNLLGHYLLTRLLLPTMRDGARVVHVSSGSHYHAHALDFDLLRVPTRSLIGAREYAVSKLCVMLFHHELTRRRARGGDYRDYPVSLAADPGDVASEAWRHVPWPVRPFLVWGMKSPALGARTSVFCATHPSLEQESGGFYVDAAPRAPSALSYDPALARALWDRSAEWSGFEG